MRAEELDGGGLPARLAWGHERRGVAFGGRVSTVAGGGATSEASPLDSAAASGEHERGLGLQTLRDGNAAVPPSGARVGTAMDLRMGR